MSKKIRFILGLHCHQPVGNFDHVFEEGYRVSYLPFLETLARFPALRVSLHYSGPLLEWISERHPEFFSLFSRLLEAGQLEFTGGGHYEPILPVIPRRDSLGQIRYMSRYLKQRLGVRVRGAWLTERIWEPSLPGLLSEAGLEFITVDDFHFLAAGFDVESLHDYYLSDDQGAVIRIFPISQRLRYLVPFHPVEEVLDFFRRKAEHLPEGAALVLADDGEKFGMWPGTHDWVYSQGWLERFFTALSESQDWLEMSSFGQVLDSSPPAGRVYLPTSSYFEMGGWALPAEASERLAGLQVRLEQEGRLAEFFPFLRGSFWRNFLVKYPESGWMHKRMCDTSRLVHQALGDQPYGSGRLPEPLRQLWMAQCNCAYWHGIFGGLYLPHLRHAIYACLIRAEKLLRRGTGSAGKAEAEALDLDLDGQPEIRLGDNRVNLFIKPSQGGAIVELDDLNSEFNLIDTLARRREPYHRKMTLGAGEDGAEGGHASIHERQFTDKLPAGSFVYDPYPRWMLREHFFAEKPLDFQQASRGLPSDLGDFADNAWDWRLAPPKGSRAGCRLTRRGSVSLPGADPVNLLLRKQITLAGGSGSIAVDYRMTNQGVSPLKIFFGVSFNLTVLGPRDPAVGLELSDGSRTGLAVGALFPGGRTFTVYNQREHVNLGFLFTPRPELLVQYPVETISQSESGIDRTYQASCLMPLWPVELKPLSSKGFKLTLTLSN